MEPIKHTYTSVQNIGRYFSGLNSAGGPASRGGTWDSTANAGIFTLTLSNTGSGYDNLSFRCVYRP